MTAEIDEHSEAEESPAPAVDVPELPATALRDALEFAVGIAAAGQKLRPALVFPAGLKPFLKFQRLDKTSLPQVRRAVVGDDDFRNRIACVASPELVDDIGIAWLQRDQGWQQRVLELHEAARADADSAAADVALRRAEKRREAAEQAATRAQAELLAARDDVGRERARREKAEARASAANTELDSLRREVAQAQRELGKARAKLATETERADRAGALESLLNVRVRELEAVRDALLAQRAAEIAAAHAPSPDVVHVARMASVEASRALEQAASATHELAKSLAKAAVALLADVPMSSDEIAVAAVRATTRRGARRKPIGIPGGVYGDTVAAAVHLLRTPHVCVIVDGYNVAKLAWPQLDLMHQRESCIVLLEDLSRRFGTDIRLIFDGADVVGASSGRRLIRVQYSPSGVTADDVIRAEVSALPAKTPVVVVTNDQAIVTDVRNSGVNVLSSDTLLATGRSARV